MYAVIIIIMHYVSVMLSLNREQLNAEGDFQKVQAEFDTDIGFTWLFKNHNYITSDMLDSCKTSE